MGRAFFYLPVPIVGANASSAAAGFDPANVANDHMGVVYKSAGGTDTVSIIVDLGSPQMIDTALLFGCTGAQSSWIWQVDSASNLAFTSDVTIHTTASSFLAGSASPTHGRGVALWAADNVPAAKRYWRFTIGNIANAAVTIARIALGQRITLARNFAFGGAFGVRDLGSVNFSPSGVRLLRQASKLRTVGITFPAVTKEEAEAKVQPLVEQAAGQLPIVLVTDPDAHPLRQRRCWFGHLTGELGTIWRSAQAWEWRASLIDLVPIPAGASGAIDATEPSITSPATFTVDENVVLNEAATADTAVTWSKGGLDAGLVTLNTATGAWSLPAQDYEIRQSVSFVLIATKQSNGLSAIQPITVAIGDVAEGGGGTPAPVFSTAPVITGTATEGQVLSATTGTASNSPTYALQWKRNGTDISGATGSTYLLVTADVGTTITVTSTATNAGGSASSTSTATATVAAAPPAGSTARSASTITRTSGATTFPPTVSFTRPIDWADGDKAIMQWSADVAFVSGVSETPTPVTLAAATTSYDFGLSAITSGSRFIRMAAWSGTRPGTLTFSNIINVGDVVAPTLNDGTTSSAENAPMAVSITSSEAAYLTLGGADASLLEIVPATGLLTSATVRLIGNANLDYETKASYSFTVTGTDPAGNVGTGTYTHNVNDVFEAVPTTLDASSKSGNITLSNGSKTATGTASAGWQSVRSNNPLPTGKGYFEFRYDTKVDNIVIGVIQAAFTNYSATTDLTGTASAAGFLSQADYSDVRGPSGANTNITGQLGGGGGAGKIYQVAYDTATGKFWPGINNTFAGNPAAGTGGFTMPTGALHALAAVVQNDVVTYRPLSSEQAYAPPSGFTAVG